MLMMVCCCFSALAWIWAKERVTGIFGSSNMQLGFRRIEDSYQWR
jgi:hypothetical protein